MCMLALTFPWYRYKTERGVTGIPCAGTEGLRSRGPVRKGWDRILALALPSIFSPLLTKSHVTSISL